MSSDLRRYYADRAAEYDRVYQKPERQADLACLREALCARLKGQRVLEVACGTGYWTELIGRVAASVLATDVNPEVLAIAKARCEGIAGVRFVEADAYALTGVAGDFTAAFAGFWWSHIPKDRIPAFLSALHSMLPQGGWVIFVDNRYVPGSSTPIARTDADGNTYQNRRLQDGRSYEVLKNFPDEGEIRLLLGDAATQVQYEALTYYWLVAYRIG